MEVALRYTLVNTVYTVYNIHIALHCLNNNMYAYIYF